MAMKFQGLVTDFVSPRGAAFAHDSSGQRLGPSVSTVIVVDDDPATRSLMRLILEIDGHWVVEAEHGGHALEIIGPDLLPDVVVTDLKMPVVSGAELIGRLQSEPRTSVIPIIVVSAHSTEARALQAAGLVDAVVTKPFYASALADCVRAVTHGPVRPQHAA
jgi:CheY-like chemotaxis protein